MTDPDRDPVEELAEEYMSRWRRGERPSVTEYARRLPDRADEIEELFRAMILMERFKERESEETGAGPRPPVSAARIERLGDYRILAEIGRGGMGIVYEAEQVSLGRRVALKILPAGALASPGRIARFRREAQAAAGLHHTNIVQVFGAGEEEGHAYYVMQRIEGRGLDAVLADGAPLPPRRAAEIALDVARALAYAHKKGTLHRDIKPANLLVDSAGTVLVTDFGLAKVLGGDDELTNTGDLVGTLRYMAPERFAGRSDERSDVYGLGLTLYEMLTGRPAWGSSDPAELASRIRGEEPPAPGRVRPGLPRDLETITLTAIARDPEHRYASADALAEDLARFLEDRPILARRAGPAERLWRWCRRNRALAALSATAAASVLFAAAAGWTAWLTATGALDREEARRQEAEANVALSLDSFEEIFERLSAPPGPGGPGGPGGPPGRGGEDAEAGILQSILSFYDRFAERNATNPRLRFEAARSWRRVAALRERRGEDAEAGEALDRALESFQALVAEFPDDARYARELAETRSMLHARRALALAESGDRAGAVRERDALRAEIATLEAAGGGVAGGPRPPGPGMGQVYRRLAEVERALGNEAAAADASRRAAAERERGPGRPGRFAPLDRPGR